MTKIKFEYLSGQEGGLPPLLTTVGTERGQAPFLTSEITMVES